MADLTPADTDEVRDIIAWTVAEKASLGVVGGGSKAGLGRPVNASHRLSTARLDGIVDYAPSELVLTARVTDRIGAGQHPDLPEQPSAKDVFLRLRDLRNTW